MMHPDSQNNFRNQILYDDKIIIKPKHTSKNKDKGGIVDLENYYHANINNNIGGGTNYKEYSSVSDPLNEDSIHKYVNT